MQTILLPIVIFTFAIVCIVNTQYPGEPCNILSKEDGICTPLQACRAAVDGLKNGIIPQNCNFYGQEPVVCCSTNENVFKSGFKAALNCLHRKSRRLLQSIVGGKKSLSREFPHMAILGYGNESNIQWGCGGSLISEKYILTAGHCLYNREFGNIKFVRLGDLNIASTVDDASPQDFKAQNLIRHKDHRPPLKYNDIALIELDREVKITNYVDFACLHISREFPTSVWTATGWGKLQFDGETSDHLQKVDLLEVEHQQCNDIYKNTNTKKLNKGIIDESQICAGDLYKDTCQGDSGGPLQFNSKPTHVIVGVTSFGKTCGNFNKPGVYTRVSYYIPWIESIVWPD